MEYIGVFHKKMWKKSYKNPIAATLAFWAEDGKMKEKAVVLPGGKKGDCL